MTRPGYVQPAAPGWWVRTNRVGMLDTAYRWDTTVEGILHPVGTAEGDYAYAGSAVGSQPNVQVVGSAVIAAAASITLPAHQAGDLICIYAFNGTRTDTIPSAPAAGGTVPTWVTPTNGTASGFQAHRFTRAIATANNHTSGSWPNASMLIAVVLRNVHQTTPIGVVGSSATAVATITGPAVTLTNTTGNAMLLFFGGGGDHVNTLSSISAAPTGYTRLVASVPGNYGAFLNHKNSSTSDGAITQALGSSVYGVGIHVEVLPA